MTDSQSNSDPPPKGRQINAIDATNGDLARAVHVGSGGTPIEQQTVIYQPPPPPAGPNRFRIEAKVEWEL